MTRKIALMIGLIASMAFRASTAEEILVAPNEIRNLGIEFAAPELAREVAAIEATARVVIPPMGDAVVSAPHSGLLAGLNVSVGDEVARGQVIARLQSSDFLALQREFLDALNANLLAQNEFERDQQLFDEGIISGRRLQETTTRARIAATSFNEHRQLLQIAGLDGAEIRSLETEQKLLQVLEIRAPFDGVILDRMATAGERLDAMSPVYRVGDLSSLWLEINVPQEKLAAVQTGMKVGVTGCPVRLPAEVTTIGRSIDPATQSIMVRATLTEAGHGLKPGQFVSARIVAGHATRFQEAVWVVPAAAVTRRGASHFLFVRTANGFDVREAIIVGADADRLYLSVDIDTDSSIAVSGVSALKSLWAAQKESDG
jgi:cobalt-zinc-cadmium efflux system membrane fusion protein